MSSSLYKERYPPLGKWQFSLVLVAWEIHDREELIDRSMIQGPLEHILIFMVVCGSWKVRHTCSHYQALECSNRENSEIGESMRQSSSLSILCIKVNFGAQGSIHKLIYSNVIPKIIFAANHLFSKQWTNMFCSSEWKFNIQFCVNGQLSGLDENKQSHFYYRYRVKMKDGKK